MKDLRSKIYKVIGIVSLLIFVSFSFSPSKALAITASFDSEETLLMQDDKGIGVKVCKGLDVSSGVDRKETPPIRLRSDPNTACCGDEVRLEVTLDTEVKPGGYVLFDGDAILFEGSSCNSSKDEDELHINELVKIDVPRYVDFELREKDNLAKGTLKLEVRD